MSREGSSCCIYEVTAKDKKVLCTLQNKKPQGSALSLARVCTAWLDVYHGLHSCVRITLISLHHSVAERVASCDKHVIRLPASQIESSYGLGRAEP